jgi:hypothetical protein
MDFPIIIGQLLAGFPNEPISAGSTLFKGDFGDFVDRTSPDNAASLV